jgi:hypothetical protein
MTGIAWKAFDLQGSTYDLSHLHPFDFVFIVPAKGDKPEQRYQINVSFSLHCFSRGFKEGETALEEWCYADNREKRIICLDRHALSLELPRVIREVGQRKCFHTNHDNFVTIEIIDKAGEPHDYTVFFTVSKAGKGTGLNLFVQSAYVRDRIPLKSKPKPIKFMVIAHNTAHNKKIKAPR